MGQIVMRASGTGTPAAPASSIQFNNAGAFGGDADFTFASATNVITLGSTAIPGSVVAPVAVNADGAGLTFTTAAGNGVNKNGGNFVINLGAASGPLDTINRNGKFLINGANGEGSLNLSNYDMLFTATAPIDSGFFCQNLGTDANSICAHTAQNNVGTSVQFLMTSSTPTDLSGFFGNGALVSGLTIGCGILGSPACPFVFGTSQACMLISPALGSAVKFFGNVGFNATNPIAKPNVTGLKAGNAALASLLTALANYGLITDSTGA